MARYSGNSPFIRHRHQLKFLYMSLPTDAGANAFVAGLSGASQKLGYLHGACVALSSILRCDS